VLSDSWRVWRAGRPAGDLALLDPDFGAEGVAELRAYTDDESESAFSRIEAAKALMKS
jgi:hypothetical protein